MFYAVCVLPWLWLFRFFYRAWDVIEEYILYWYFALPFDISISDWAMLEDRKFWPKKVMRMMWFMLIRYITKLWMSIFLFHQMCNCHIILDIILCRKTLVMYYFSIRFGYAFSPLKHFILILRVQDLVIHCIEIHYICINLYISLIILMDLYFL